MRRLGFGGRGFGRFAGALFAALQARIARCRELVLELFDPARGIDELELARKERMASAADIDLQLGDGAACGKAIPATAFDGGRDVSGVDIFFHRRNSANSSVKEGRPENL